MELVNTLAEAYADKYTTPEDNLLKSIYDDTVANHPHAHMISGHIQGKFLEFLSCMIKPKYILEIGTFTGYSAICLAKGLREDGELHTIELREEDANNCEKKFIQSGYNKKIHLHRGNALDIIPKLTFKWDIVFIDADKQGYIAYYELILPRLNENGLIIADNVLFHGQVLEEKITGKNATAIDSFNQYVAKDSRTEQVMLTIRDGLLLIKKKK